MKNMKNMKDHLNTVAALVFSGFIFGPAADVQAAERAATFISQVPPPATMALGGTANVSITMRNDGTLTWPANSEWGLGARNPENNSTWGLSRVQSTVDVLPGETVTYNFVATAPLELTGIYNFQWWMLQDGVAWFGDLTPNVQVIVVNPPPGTRPNFATFISQVAPPATMALGATASVSVTMRNDGTNTWPAGGEWRLGVQNLQNSNINWGISRVLTPTEVIPGQQVTFNFMVTAPSTAGGCNFQWRMLQEDIAWFGDYTPNIAVNVGGVPVYGVPNGAQFISQVAPPTSMTPGQTANVSVTMKNVGDNSWPADGDWRLGAQPQGNTSWGIERVQPPSAVSPGQEVTFTFSVTAPLTLGDYNFQWQMLREGVMWFGDRTPDVVVTVAEASGGYEPQPLAIVFTGSNRTIEYLRLIGEASPAVVETSDNLINWSDVTAQPTLYPITQLGVGDGMEKVTIQILDTATKRFFRLRD